MMDRMNLVSSLDRILLWCLYEKCVHAKNVLSNFKDLEIGIHTL